MALQSRKYGSQHVQYDRDIKGSIGLLKKQRSLSALSTSRSRKLPKSQSRSPSPPTPVTPKIPEQYRSSIPSTLTGEDRLIQTEGKNHESTARSQAAWGLQSEYSQRRHSREKQRSHERTVSREKCEDGIVNPQSAMPEKAFQTIEGFPRKPQIHHSPTFPLRQHRSHKALHQPTGRAEPRLRGFSTTANSSRAETPSDIVHHQRPATAGGDTSVNDGNIFLHNQDEQLPSPSKALMPRNQWRDLQRLEEVRTSFRSALTNSSSMVNAASTDRSSVATRCTSVSESTIEILGNGPQQDICMTVDDAIDMYATGFADEVPEEPKDLEDISTEQRRSMRIAEAINDTIGSNLLPPERPSTSASRSSAAIMSGAAFTHESPSSTPTILPPTSTRDQYGFLKASHYVNSSQYDAWHSGYFPTQERRNRKWLSYMRDSKLSIYTPSDFPARSAKTQRYIRKGIPPAWRGAAWFFYAGGDIHLQKNPNLYSTLVARFSELSDNDKEIIERDLHRTFPDNIHFKPEPLPTIESSLLKSLRNVLRAFSLHCPRIGYCQSLNFIAGLLLLFLPEEKAFWMLHIITSTYLPGTHEISLEGANVDLWVLMTTLKDSLPSIWTKISKGSDNEPGSLGVKLPPISLCTTSWFMSLFIGTLPIESVLRVWDVLFYEGSRTLFRVAIAIFRIGEQKIKAVNESMEMFQVVQGLPREMLDVGLLLNVALKRGGVSQEWVERKRWARKKWYAKERARAMGVSAMEEVEDVDVRPRRAESLWRRRK